MFFEIKHPNWLKQVTWLATSNQSALFKHSYAMLKFVKDIDFRLRQKLFTLRLKYFIGWRMNLIFGELRVWIPPLPQVMEKQNSAL